MKRLAALVFAIVLFSCDKDSPQPLVPEFLKESVVVTTRTKADLATFIQSNAIPIPQSEIQSNVTVYKITYKTTFNGQEITASALVSLPETTSPAPMVSFQHGTIASNAEALTLTPESSGLMSFYASISTPGIIGVVPDFIGFGASSDILHPYYVQKPTADAIIDALKAARELALLNGVNFNEKLFLAGYSQGGYATMVAHKAIEETNPEHFDLVASFPSSGGYDIKGVQEYFFKQTEYDQPFYLAFVSMAYKTHLSLPNVISDVFKEPYATRIPSLFDGKNSSGDINAQLTDNIADLLQSDILEHINTDPKYKYINDAFADNSPIKWVPKKKMFMYHGDIDTTVPYQNSVDVYNQFIEQGASKDVVTFTPLPFSTHESGVTPYLAKFINEILILK